MKHLSYNSTFTFESGNQTAAGNLAPLIQMALELRNLSEG